MSDKNKKVLVIGIAGALTESLKGSIQELLKDQKGVIIVDGAEIEKEKTDLKNQIDSLKIEVSEVTNLKAKILELEKLKEAHVLEIVSLNEKNKAFSNELAELSAELDNSQTLSDAGFVTVKSGKKSYRVLGKKFSYNNREYTAEQLVKNPKLIDELVGIGSGILIEVKGDKK